MPVLLKQNKILTSDGKILVRSEPTPFDLPNLKLYLSTTRMFQYADATLMPNMLDYSGNNYQATQANSGFQPTFEINEFGINAGLKMLTDDYLEILSSTGIQMLNGSNQFTIQCLAKRTTISTSGYVLVMGDTALTSQKIFTGWAASGTILIAGKRLNSDTRSDLNFSSNDLLVHFIQITLNPSNAQVSVYMDGIFRGIIQFTIGNMDSFTNIIIGNNSITTKTAGAAIINGISVSTSYSDPNTIAAQYRGYLSRGYL